MRSNQERMRVSLERLLGRPVDFPVEIALLRRKPVCCRIPTTRDLVIFPDEGPFSLVVNPDQVMSIRAVRKAS